MAYILFLLVATMCHFHLLVVCQVALFPYQKLPVIKTTFTMHCFFKPLVLAACCTLLCQGIKAQDTSFNSKHAAIYFPYPMYKEHWRSSIGFTLMTTPEDITEEVRLRIPCGDYHLLRKINNHFILDSRLLFQVLQNHVSTGIHYVRPVNENVYISAGNDIGFWFGFLKLSGFNSKALGWIDYPNLSVGYKTKKDLLITFKAQVSFNLYYQAANGAVKYSSSQRYYNGETFTLALEQPFYNKKHLTLAFSAISNKFFWQTWALFYKTNREIFYPQITVGFIL